MSNRQESLDVADATKIHGEINQLRNQEFLICSFALLLYGASFQTVAQEPGLAIPLLMIYGTLFYWHYALCALQTKLSVYLSLTRLSEWESDYRGFGNIITHPGQRTAATVIFVVLGIISTAVPGWKLLGAQSPTNSSELLVLMIVFLLVYVSLILFFGLKSYPDKRALYEKTWREILEKNGRKLPTSSPVSMSPAEDA